MAKVTNGSGGAAPNLLSDDEAAASSSSNAAAAASEMEIDPGRLWDWGYVQHRALKRAYGATDVAALARRFGGGGLRTAGRFIHNGKLSDILD